MKPNLAPRARGALVGEWDIGGAFMAFDGPEWRVEYTTDHGRRADIVLSVIGLQYADGRALREIIIDCPDTPIITPAEARELARALIAAADSAEGRFARAARPASQKSRSSSSVTTALSITYDEP